MEINAVNASNNFLTNVDSLVFNKASAATDENVAQASDSLKFDDTVDLSTTAHAIVEWISSYKSTLGSHIGTIHYMSVDSDVGLVVDKKLLEANQNLLTYLESASIAEKSSMEYQDYVNKLRIYIAKIQNTLAEAEEGANKDHDAAQPANETIANNAEAANENSTEQPVNNSLGAFLTKSMGEFRNKLKEFIMPSGVNIANEEQDS